MNLKKIDLLTVLIILAGTYSNVYAQDVPHPWPINRRAGLDLPIDPKDTSTPPTSQDQIGTKPIPSPENGKVAIPNEIRTRVKSVSLENVPPITEPTPEPPEKVSIYGMQIETSQIVFVIDSSGSMIWHKRIEKAKDELSRSVSGLDSTVEFDSLTYGTNVGPVLWGKLRKADSGAKEEALKWINAIHPGGRTATGPAVAYTFKKYSAKDVVLITDGVPNEPEINGKKITLAQTTEMILSARTDEKLHVVGIGAEGLFREFLQNLAAKCGGSYVDGGQ